MLPRELDKYTNYNAYFIAGRTGAYKVDEIRICQVVKELRVMFKKPYVRFMWVSNRDSATCIVMNGNERVTKLVAFDEVEKAVKDWLMNKPNILGV